MKRKSASTPFQGHKTIKAPVGFSPTDASLNT